MVYLGLGIVGVFNGILGIFLLKELKIDTPSIPSFMKGFKV
jgi:hypothetical protein